MCGRLVRIRKDKMMLNVMWKICHAYSGRECVQQYTELCVKGTTDAILVCHLNSLESSVGATKHFLVATMCLLFLEIYKGGI